MVSGDFLLGVSDVGSSPTTSETFMSIVQTLQGFDSSTLGDVVPVTYPKLPGTALWL